MNVINLAAQDNFAEIIQSQPIPVIVDFWAPWCAPCRMLAPELAGASEEFGDKLQVLKVNIDDFAELASGQYKVLGVPTLVLFKDGREKGRLVGYRSRTAIKAFIEKNL
ncbi:MAG: thioredoxin [Acidaminococcales bacterium]|jgi:thioredoxin 1|nr:thioredoxin [Acidaminococcales bacterium]